jgi:hypothetical protein
MLADIAHHCETTASSKNPQYARILGDKLSSFMVKLLAVLVSEEA